MIRNAKPSGNYFYMNLNIWRDFQICISVPLTHLTFYKCTHVTDLTFYKCTHVTHLTFNVLDIIIYKCTFLHS